MVTRPTPGPAARLDTPAFFDNFAKSCRGPVGAPRSSGVEPVNWSSTQHTAGRTRLDNARGRLAALRVPTRRHRHHHHHHLLAGFLMAAPGVRGASVCGAI
ncbi:hypothetical protein E2C01_033482 [Portunus trituberculatus]|uniref:Uncharacterized protein n=1 Tax=Portunus trituberculatus TaxID=210409 RepID=A0A5B7F3U9_PORTR|nr:hypothetical protein [Portunus trituberculatus]